MENNAKMSREELARMLEEAQKTAEETMSKLSPEERQQAEMKAQQMMANEQARLQQISENAARFAGTAAQSNTPSTQEKPADYVPPAVQQEHQRRVRYCQNCGTPGNGNFCANCGKPLS